MRPFGALLSYEEAKRIVDAHIKPVSRTETVGIDDAVGRVLAEPLVAALSIPPFDRAAMDGYAVKAKDTFNAGQRNPKMLKLIGELTAGQTPKATVKAGECLQIATGAMMPRGADAVVMVEDTESAGGEVKIFKSVSPRANVSLVGEDIREGTPVLKAGVMLDAGKIGVLATQGMTKVQVYARPRVAILPSGEEVAELGKKTRRGSVYDVNSHTVASIVTENGGIPVISGVVHDDPQDIRDKITKALKNDLIVISGGSSVGTRDLLVTVLHEWGDILFHGIQVKPGKPTLFAIIEGKPVFGMPGYPTSCLINSYLFLLPTVRKMARLLPRRGETVVVKLGRRVSGSVGRRQFLTVRVEVDEAMPAFKESGSITSVADADGYIEIPENIDLLEKGERVTVTLF
ncbi:MAG: molybdenum cofactor biosynthesis protein [Chloroflexi bacterium]|nr:molybdenum cofactor biosynthesis protein [Chloroflexota bacterium]